MTETMRNDLLIGSLVILLGYLIYEVRLKLALRSSRTDEERKKYHLENDIKQHPFYYILGGWIVGWIWFVLMILAVVYTAIYGLFVFIKLILILLKNFVLRLFVKVFQK